MKKLRIGIIGCGVIGSELAKACIEKFGEKVELAALCDVDPKKAASLAARIGKNIPVLSIDSLIRKSDFVIEAASAAVSADIAKRAIKAGKDVIIMSVGGLINAQDIFELARRKERYIFLPSGAISGLDGVKSASMAGIKSATLITRKPPGGLKGAPYIKANGIDLDSIKSETVIFQGSAKDAIKGFPANVNVSVALSLAGIGPERTEVKIITSPEYKTNSHEMILEGDFGRLTTKTENLPSPNNPKTSFLAALSGIATLKGALDYIKVGN